MSYLRQNTAVIVTVGPFYDKTTGVDIETALTITNERLTLTADTDAGSAPTNILDNVTGATSGTSNDLNYITGNDAGMMQLELSAADTNRVGRMLLSVTDAANHVPVFHEFFVLPQAIFDWLTGVIVPLPSNVTQLGGGSQSLTDLKDFADDGYDPSTNKVQGVVLVDTVTTYTGNTPQTGDAFARIGAAGAGLTAIDLPNQTMDITGNLSGSVGSVTAGVTVTTNNDKTGYALSSAGVQAVWDALTSALTTAGSIGKWIVDKLDVVLSTKASQASVDALGTDLTTLLGRFSAARAGYIDNLNVGGAVASQADITAINQSASRRIILTTVGQYERPESGSTVYTVEARLYDGDGAAVNADSTPTLTGTGQTSGSLAANLSAASNPSTGLYRWTYTVAAAAAIEPVRFDISAAIASATFTLSAYTQITDLVGSTWTSADRTKLESLFNKLPSKAYLTGTGNSDGDVQLDEATGGLNSTAKADVNTEAAAALATYAPATAAALTTVGTNVSTLLTRIPSALFAGITSLAQWLGLFAGKQTADATARTEVRATGAGSGTYDETTDSQEAARDNMAAPPSAAVIADAVWEEALADHEGTAGSTAEALADAGGAGASAADIADAVLDEALAGHASAGTLGKAVSDTLAKVTPLPADPASATGPVGSVTSGVALSPAGVQAIWDALTSALTTAGSIGKWIVDKLNAAISTVATPAQVNTEAAAVLATAGVTPTRAGYFDKLNISGNVASSSEVTSIQNNTNVVKVVPTTIERPDSGTVTYRVEVLLYDDVGNMEVPDSAPTIALVNQSGTDRSSRLDSTTMALISTGRYRAIYMADVADTLEQLVWAFTVVEGGATRVYGSQSLIVDTTAVDFTAADRTKLEAVHTKLPSKLYLVGTSNSDGDIQQDEATGGLSTTAKANVRTEADAALASYDPPTQAELTAAVVSLNAAITALNNITAAAARDAVFLQVIEGTTTFLQAQRAMLAGDANNVTVDLGTGQVILKSQDGTKNRVTSMTTIDGVRTVTGRDLT